MTRTVIVYFMGRSYTARMAPMPASADCCATSTPAAAGRSFIAIMTTVAALGGWPRSRASPVTFQGLSWCSIAARPYSHRLTLLRLRLIALLPHLAGRLLAFSLRAQCRTMTCRCSAIPRQR
jgi:hypothetical protein